MAFHARNSGNHIHGTRVFPAPENRAVFINKAPEKPRGSPTQALNNNFLTPRITNDIVYENVKPVLLILRIMGCLPMSKTSPGKIAVRMGSTSMIYSVALFTLIVTYVVYLTLNKVQFVRRTEGKFEEAVIEYLFTIYLFPLVIVPLMWYESPKIGQILNSWVDFEAEYNKLSHRALPVHLYQKCLVMAAVAPVVAVASVMITHWTMVNFQVAQIIPYIYLQSLIYSLGVYWYLLCEILSLCAATLAEDFQQALRNIGPAGRVAQYRSLWLRLSKLARDTGLASTYTFAFIFIYLFLIITLSVYGLLSQISDGLGTKDIGLAVTGCCSILLLFFICDEAHHAAHNVRTNFQKKLLMVELSWMNSDAQTEVNMFLRATEMNDCRISLGGFFDVNRNLFKALMTTMVTYLVVLLQFQISIPGEDTPKDDQEGAANSTASESAATTASTLLTTVLTKKKKKN